MYQKLPPLSGLNDMFQCELSEELLEFIFNRLVKLEI